MDKKAVQTFAGSMKDALKKELVASATALGVSLIRCLGELLTASANEFAAKTQRLITSDNEKKSEDVK